MKITEKLCWPSSWPRQPFAKRKTARFKTRTVGEAQAECVKQIKLLGGDKITISSDTSGRNARPGDSGVSVYFQFEKRNLVLACDKWNTVPHNLWAIAKHIEALRGQNRWGVGSAAQAFAGYLLLPEKTDCDWQTKLGIGADSSIAEIKTAFRSAAKQLHPDAGGSDLQMASLNKAYQTALSEAQGIQ